MFARSDRLVWSDLRRSGITVETGDLVDRQLPAKGLSAELRLNLQECSIPAKLHIGVSLLVSDVVPK